MTKINSFTVVTPVFNREDCIRRCIEIVLSQNYPALEFWIVDDSTDSTSDVIKNYAIHHSCIKYHKPSKRRGINAARNYAIQNSTADFVIFLDSDDYFIPDALYIINQEINNHPDFLHYLFAQDDRQSYYKTNSSLNKELQVISFSDFLTGKVGGDFVHVMHIGVLQKYPFNEELLYEYVTFLQLYKAESKLQFVNLTVVKRDRNRSDAATKVMQLINNNAINNQYLTLNEDIHLFAEDYINCGARYLLYKKICRLYLLSLAQGKYSQNRKIEILSFSYKMEIPFYYILFSHLRIGFLIKYLIFAFSAIKSIFKKNK